MTPKSSVIRQSSVTPRERATLSGGTSAAPIYEAIQKLIQARRRTKGRIIDVGCGNGSLQTFLTPAFSYVGVDINRYAAFPASGNFIEADLNTPLFAIESGTADIVVSAETIEHLETREVYAESFAGSPNREAWSS